MASSSNPVDATPPWLELPREITAMILHKLGAIEILMTAQKVCTAWRSVCQDPSMWRCIDMGYAGDLWDVPYDLEEICRHAVDRSQGQLIDIKIEYCGDDDLLLYISQRSPQLKCLQVVLSHITGEAVREAVKNFPKLVELHIYYTSINTETIETIGQSCPNLKSFKFNNRWYEKHHHIESDLEALAIAANMPQLNHLQLFGNKMTNEGLQAILDGCPNLRSLDLRQCFNVHLCGNLGRLCSQRITDLRRPHDPTDDYRFNGEIYDYATSYDDDDYITGFSDMDMVSDYDDYLEFSGASGSSYDYEEEIFVD